MSLTGTVPAPGATDVPVDVRLAALFTNDGCLSGGGWTLTLTRADSGAVVAETTITEAQVVDAALGELFPPVLEPHTAYVFTVGPELAEVGFTTGEGVVVGLDGAPVLTDVAARWQGEDANFHVRGGTTLEWSATPAADPDGLSLLQITDDATARARDAHLPETLPASTFWEDDRRPAQVCPKVRQIDGKGVATPFSEPVCVAVGHGCSTSGLPVNAGVGALVAALLRRRTTPRRTRGGRP